MVIKKIKDELFYSNYVKKNQKEVISKFASSEEYSRAPSPLTIFMAGSTGVGKTEYSKRFIAKLKEQDPTTNIVRLDADEIKKYLSNDEDMGVLHRASTLAVAKIFDHVNSKGYNLLLDGTFSDYKIASEDVRRAIGRGRTVGIQYLYRDPLEAWRYTQIRTLSKEERFRRISKDVFIASLFDSHENIRLIKEEYGSKIEIDVAILSGDKTRKVHYNISGAIENYVRIAYTREELYERLYDAFEEEEVGTNSEI